MRTCKYHGRKVHRGEAGWYRCLWLKKAHRPSECKKCGWIGHDGQLGKLRTLLGDGYYLGKCPDCGAENHAFTVENIVALEGFEVVEVGQ